MKKKCLFYFSLCSLLLFSACNGNDEQMIDEGGSGEVQFNLSSNVTYPSSTGTRGLDEAQNINNYTVELSDAKGNKLFSKLHKDLEPSMKIDAGAYLVRAFWGEDVPAGYDKLYVEGSIPFALGKGERKDVKFTCVPANAKIKVVYSSDFSQYYSDCTIGFKTPHLLSPFLMPKSESNKSLYLKAGNEDDLTLTFELKDKNGATIVPKGFGEQKMTLSARDFLTITIKPKVTEVEAGKIKGITVTIDTSVNTEEIDITIPDEFL